MIIADTSCLILLSKIGRLNLLPQLFGGCRITPAVAAEYGLAIPAWLEIQEPTVRLPAQLLTRSIHAGEHSALALALELPGSLLILDDEPARRLAQQLRLRFTGTVGLLALAKSQGLLLSVRPVAAELRAVGMWLSDAVAERVCRAAGE